MLTTPPNIYERHSWKPLIPKSYPLGAPWIRKEEARRAAWRRQRLLAEPALQHGGPKEVAAGS